MLTVQACPGRPKRCPLLDPFGPWIGIPCKSPRPTRILLCRFSGTTSRLWPLLLLSFFVSSFEGAGGGRPESLHSVQYTPLPHQLGTVYNPSSTSGPADQRQQAKRKRKRRRNKKRTFGGGNHELAADQSQHGSFVALHNRHVRSIRPHYFVTALPCPSLSSKPLPTSVNAKPQVHGIYPSSTNGLHKTQQRKREEGSHVPSAAETQLTIVCWPSQPSFTLPMINRSCETSSTHA
ncbi:hypothetical protein B0J13DRAFT_312393 [Dactylonectria estremocensis]|uniref:Uncharacterized protein n=1 Tax=Dactylonectria estremocensis TaxID=1079267 RepID=A0A9P9F247_9HYPO|nr:hypothetical protein B0J13DRAFT_312393 [Dactylonectria estremocensis]